MTENDGDALRGLRPDRRPLLWAVVANGVLAVALLGTPYGRGHFRARGIALDFGRFAACLYGGRPTGAPGIALPPGDEEHFASQMLTAGRGWPSSCLVPLLRVPRSPATFLLPGTKTAELDVYRGTELVRRELSRFAEARAAGATRVSHRPLRAVGRLRAALSELGGATDEEGLRERDAIRFPRAASVPWPSRVPLDARGDAAIMLRANADGLVVSALDARGLSVVRVRAGLVDTQRAARVPGVRAAWLAEDGTPWAFFATPRERCVDDAEHCARRATGVVKLAPGASALPAPVWLGGHPWNDDAESALRVVPGGVELLARGEGGGVAWRGFDVTDATPGGQAPLVAARERALGSVLAASWLDAGVAVLVDDDAGAHVALEPPLTALEPPTTVGPALPHAAGEPAWLRACAAGGRTWLAFGTGHAARLFDAADPAHVAALDVDAAGETAALACDTEGALLVLPERIEERADVVACTWSTCEVAGRIHVPRAPLLAVVRAGGRGLVFAAGRVASEAAVEMHRFGVRGERLGPPVYPGACWDDDTGLCGRPFVDARSGRLLVGTHEGSDLRVVESIDDGQHWRVLAGLH